MSRRQEQKPYTPEILARAETLHGSGLDWKTVAERVGRTYGSLMTTRSHIKNHRTHTTVGEMRAKSKRQLAYVEVLISLGMKPKDMRGIFNLSGGGMSMRLLNWGLDREERIALRLADERFAALLTEARAIVREHAGTSLPHRKKSELRSLKGALFRGSELQHAEIDALLQQPLPLQTIENRSGT